MTPVTFAGCFGWLHPGRGTTGVVLCSAFGREEMNAYRGLRHLAELLAGSGFHVLRFDYPGTGDSSGSETDPDRLAAWRGSIPAAAGFLRSVTDTERVILIGLRLGATLALLASREIEQVAAIACLAPVLSGRSYLRELRLLANAWRDANLLPADQHPGGDLDVVGDRLTPATLRDLSGLDLRTLDIGARAVLLMDDGAGPLLAGLADRLAAHGCSVSRAAFPGAVDYLQDSFSSRIPKLAFDSLLAWCAPFMAEPVPLAGPRRIYRKIDTELRLPGANEEAVRFGPSDGLFGILCRPGASRASIGPSRTAATVIMLNTGFGRRIGDGRIFVTLARRLAAIGVASFRMDLSGFGDSMSRNAADLDPYSGDTAADIVAAADALQRAGHENLFLIGNCSGAYSAFHGALAEARIRGLILVNLQRFIWKAGSSLVVENRRKRRPLQFYLRAVTQRGAWRRLASGEVATFAIALALCRRPLLSAHHEICLALEAISGVQTRSGEVMRWLRMLKSREVAVSLLYSAGDPGLSELARHLSRHRLRSLPNVEVGMIPRADHALLDHTARCRFIDMVCRVVQGHVFEQRAQMDVVPRGESHG